MTDKGMVFTKCRVCLRLILHIQFLLHALEKQNKQRHYQTRQLHCPVVCRPYFLVGISADGG